jgi:multidrug efflux pump subunit AcrB
VLLSGVAKFLFTPLALAVVFAMLTSYLLSRTLVPSMARYLLPEAHREPPVDSWWRRFLARFEAGFERVRESYRDRLGVFVTHRRFTLTCVTLVILASFFLAPVVGQDFFPTVDAGMMKLHVRAPTGTRIERTERIVEDVERTIRSIVPADELVAISDNIGTPVSYNLAFYQTDSIGPQDADILVQLQETHGPTAGYQDRIRRALAEAIPDTEFYFQAADIVSQVLNFGLSAAIDVQIQGYDLDASYQHGVRLKDAMAKIPGLTDLRIAEPLDYPTIKVDVDRAKALELGVSEADVASSLLTSLSTSFLCNRTSGSIRRTASTTASCSDAAAHDRLDSALARTPLLLDRWGPAAARQRGRDLPGVSPAVINHYSVQRVIDVNAAVTGAISAAPRPPRRAIADLGALRRARRHRARPESGDARVVHHAQRALVLAIILVYLLMVANFQSWLEPFIILLAVPGALAEVLWMLALTGTTINVESAMGAIMAVGVAVANGNLLVTFANELREEGFGPVEAAIEAGRIRLRPIIMTALAMILGMLPMALGLGGADQNAPLGRAVIGGLIAATLMTLFVVPAVYAIFGRNVIGKHERDAEIAAVSGHEALET